MKEPNVIKDHEFRHALKFALSFAAVGILLWVMVKLAPIIAIFVIALFAVYFISPLVNLLINKNFKPLFAAIGASLIILIAMFMFFYLLVPGLIGEMRELAGYITTDLLDDLFKLVNELESLDQRFNLELTDSFLSYLTEFTKQVPVHIQQLLRYLTTLSMVLVSRAWVILGLAFLVFYLVQDLEKAKVNLTLLFPQIYQKGIAHILGIIDQKVGAYIRGTLLKSVFVGALTGIGLSIMGMPFALMLGILAGALNIILYIGPVMAAVPALLLGIIPGTPSFFLILGLYLIVQALDAFVFTPVLLGKAVDLSPLTVVVVVLIGGQLMGLTGIILAIPFAAILKVLLLDYYLEKRRTAE